MTVQVNWDKKQPKIKMKEILVKININTRVSQKFCNILVTDLLHSSSYNKSSLASKVEVTVALFEATFQLVLQSHTDTSSSPLRWRIPSLKLLPPLSCSRVMSTGSEPWIRIRNNPRELGLDYILGMTSVWFPQISWVYSRN